MAPVPVPEEGIASATYPLVIAPSSDTGTVPAVPVPVDDCAASGCAAKNAGTMGSLAPIVTVDVLPTTAVVTVYASVGAAELGSETVVTRSLVSVVPAAMVFLATTMLEVLPPCWRSAPRSRGARHATRGRETDRSTGRSNTGPEARAARRRSHRSWSQ